MKVLPHITDRDLDLSQEAITSLQRADLEILQGYADAFLERTRIVAQEAGVRVVVMCNLGTDEVQPSPLDWDGTPNVLGLDPAVYGTAKRALDSVDPECEAVVLLYHPTEDVLSIYTVGPDSEVPASDAPVE